MHCANNNKSARLRIADTQYCNICRPSGKMNSAPDLPATFSIPTFPRPSPVACIRTVHHIHNFIVRRCDILDPNEPRRSHPGLLASMLFVAALSDEALGLFNGPEERDSVCKYLSLLSYRTSQPCEIRATSKPRGSWTTAFFRL